MDEGITSFIFPDFKLVESIRYEFPHHLILLEEVTLRGFEIYLVEQWLSERKLSTLITTYTGSIKDKVTAVRLTILTADETLWPALLRSYITELVESQHCRPKETESGTIYVTNLSQFPSFLNLIEVEQGDIREVWEMFNVNLNLKKMGCSGRSVLTLSHPTKSMEDKFRQTFKIHPKVDINYAARELALIIQTFLYYYNLFPAYYCDGILCDQTEEAIQSWWDTIGTKYYDIKQKQYEGLSATSVCAIISFTLNLKLRLELLNTSSIDVPKDPLNVERFRLAIGQFQKHCQKYSSGPQSLLAPSSSSQSGSVTPDDFSHFLDQSTIKSLMNFSNHKMSTQQFKNDFNKMKKMLKNTVSDISSGRTYLNLSSSNAALPDSATSAYRDSETFNYLLTLDIDKMLNFIHGKRLNYIWKGIGKSVNIEEVSLAKLIRDQLARQSQQSDKALHHGSASGSASHNAVYLSLPAISQVPSLKSSEHKKSYSSNEKSSINGSIGGLEIYDPDDPYEKKSHSNSFSKYSSTSNRKDSFNSSIWSLKDNSANFECQLYRRSSFPSMKKELNISLVDHRQDYALQEDSVIDKHISSSELNNSLKGHKRRGSFSLVESSILLWEYPFSPSINKLASDYLLIKEILDFTLKDSNDNLQKYIKELHEYIESDDPKPYNPFSKGSRKVNNKFVDAKVIDELFHKVVTKEEFLELKLKDIDLLNSRLTYELRLLTNKVKDVEDNLRQLQDFKLKKVIENLSLYQSQRPELKERLLKYQTLQNSLIGDTETVTDTQNEVLEQSSRPQGSYLLLIYLYILAVWYELLKMFSLEHKMDDKVISNTTKTVT